MSFIGSLAKGDWRGALAQAGGPIAGVAVGRTSVGDAIKEAGIDAAIAAGTAGIGAAAGKAAGSLTQEAFKSAGTGAKVLNGAAKAANAVSSAAKAGNPLSKITSSGALTGPAVGTGAISEGVKGELPDLKSAMNALKTSSTSTSTTVTGTTSGVPTQAITPEATKGSSFKAKIASAGGKVASQYGVQGALSLLSSVQSGKAAAASNKISQQSLLFQQQSYNEAQAEKEATKAQLKADATTAYSSALAFGETLQSNNPSSTNLFAGSAANGATGDYSIMSSLISTRKSSNT
jgi:hypothetical protein